MVVVDLTEFISESFDPKRWINSSVDSHRRRLPPSASTETDLTAEDVRLMSELEEALRQEADGVEAALERESSDALRRVPMACRDAMRLRDDAVALRSLVSSLLLSLRQAEGSSAESIASLARIDTVKRRMESAYTTLQDAAGLTQLSASVEDVFASGDLPKAAETLATMRHCLSAVGEVAEFANVRKQLEVLEDRLDEMVLPRLIDALTNRKIEVVQDLRGILVRIGRSKSLELQYTKIHVKPLKNLWEDFELRQRINKLEIDKHGENNTGNGTISFSSWLPSFYDETLLYLEQEWKWCMGALPEDYKSLVPKLLIEIMTELNASFVSRVNLATGDVIPETRALAKGIIDIISGDLPKGTKLKSTHLEALIEMHNMTGTFARNIQHLFSESDLSVILSTLKSVYSPYETFKVRYGQMERAILSNEITRIDIRGAVSRGVGAQGIELSETVRRMEESIPQVIVLLEASVERCITFTGGSEADELILALDDIMLQYISNLQETLKSLRTVCGVDSTPNTDPSKKDTTNVSEEEEWSIVQGALQILTVADCLTSRSSVFEASLRATLARIGTSISVSGANNRAGFDETAQGLIMSKTGALDVASLHLSDMPEKSKKLLYLLEQSKDPRFHALPLTSQRVSQFSDTVNDLVYTVLISKVKQRLSDVARMSVWSSVEEPTERPLPSFSVSPQGYAISVGEYLLTLPQQLEPLAETVGQGSDGNEEAQIFATEWMSKVTEGATALFTEQLKGIHYITDRGAQQLSADIEYLINVLSALAVTTIPPFLSTYQICLSTPRDRVKDVVKSDGGALLDLPTAHLVCKIRRISLD